MSTVKIDRAFLKDFTKMAEQALSSVAEAYGIKVAYKGGNYCHDGRAGVVKFDLTAPDASTGECLSREAQDFVNQCERYGLKPSDLGRSFASHGIGYTVTGLRASRHKYPISAARNSDGRTFKFQASVIIGQF